MRIPRLFLDDDLAEGREVVLDRPAASYLFRVLRLRAQAPVVLFNGRGGEYAARVIDPGQARLGVEAFSPRESESPLELRLVQGVSKGERMDLTVQKAVELGVSRIEPVLCQRSVVNLEGKRREKRAARWRSIAVSACEQCGRNRLPAIDTARPLGEWLSAAPADDLRLVLHPEGGRPLGAWTASPATVTLLIGPEGGFTDEEVAAAEGAGFERLGMGPRVLRTETAAIAALAAIQARWGDLG